MGKVQNRCEADAQNVNSGESIASASWLSSRRWWPRGSGETKTVTQEPNNGRVARRVPSRVKRLVRVRSVHEEGQWLIGLRDISLEGVGIYSRRPFPIDSIVTLELPMRSGTVCRTARVKNLRASAERGWIVGCLFLEALVEGDLAVQRSSRAPTRERRSKPRYSAQHERGQCRVFSMVIEGPWEMAIHNVSETGIGLISDRPFKAGMTLSVDLPGDGQEPTSLRVAHASKRQGKWLVGCAFPKPISEYEVQCLT